MYDFYLNGVLLPVTPETINTKINGRNTTLTMINEGEINVLKSPGLTTSNFTVLLPATRYHFARYLGGFKAPQYYLGIFESLKRNKTPFQWIVARQYPNGKSLHSTNMTVVLEDYTIKESAKESGFDLLVDINLKQFKSVSTKTFSVELPSATAPIAVQETRPASTAPKTSSSSKSSTKTTSTKTTTTKTTENKTSIVSTITKAVSAAVEGTKSLISNAVSALKNAASVAQTTKKVTETTRPATTVNKKVDLNLKNKMIALK